MWKKIAKGQKKIEEKGREGQQEEEETNELGGKLDKENKCSENQY